MHPVAFALHRGVFKEPLDREIGLQGQQPTPRRRRLLVKMQMSQCSQIRLVRPAEQRVELADTPAKLYGGFIIALHQMDQDEERVEEERMRVQRRQRLVAVVAP